MPPFDRRPKTPTVKKPLSGFDAHANSGSIPRAPWEREDDDEFGSPAALDLSPGDAEMEVKRIVYEKTHPLHAPVTQGGHIDHNSAMRRYMALARRAWDPAARNVPVKDRKLGSLEPDGDTRPTPLLRRSERDFPPPELPRFAREQLVAAHAALSEQELASRPDQIRAALARLPTGMRSLSVGLMETIPHQQNASDWATIGQMVLQRKDWSDTDQYVHRYILGFEGLGYDRFGRSKAGIRSELLQYGYTGATINRIWSIRRH